MSVWLLVERLENWRVDESEGFRRFGLSARAARQASKVEAGDLLAFYVSGGVSAFSDIRRSVLTGVERLRLGGDYDTAYPLALRTEPVLTLERERWLPMDEISSELALFVGKDWRQMMRTSLRRLDEADGERLIAAICARAQEPQ